MNQTTHTLVIEPRDTAIFRDGRSFSAGLGAVSLPFAPPSTVAGALRTRLGSQQGTFDDTKIAELLKVELDGPYLGYRERRTSDAFETPWNLAFAAPSDAVLFQGGSISRLVPRPEWGGNCDLPHDYLVPLGFEGSEAKDEKPDSKAPAFWTAEELQEWLGSGPAKRPAAGIPALLRQRRVHVKIDPAKQSADEGMLYSTTSLEFVDCGAKRQFALVSRFRRQETLPAAGLIPRLSHVGGEGRLAFWKTGSEKSGSELVNWPVARVSSKDIVTAGLRLYLATPAVFERGWMPGWIDPESGQGTPPGMDSLRLQLVSAAVSRAATLSGWDFKQRGPKPTRWMAPAGSVYFFQVLSQKDGDVEQLWMRSVCDHEQDRNDGFGRVLTGVFSAS